MFKVIFLTLMIGVKLMILGLRLTSPSYVIGYYCELIISIYHIRIFKHACVLNLYAGMSNLNNAAQCVDSTRLRVIVFQTDACMCLQLSYKYTFNT
jgi:hypothetical protein